MTGARRTHRRGQSVLPDEQELLRRTERGGKLFDSGLEGQVGLVERWEVRGERHFRRGNHGSESSQNSPVTKVWAGTGGRWFEEEAGEAVKASRLEALVRN